MNKKDLKLGVIIGGAVGLLVQPIILNQREGLLGILQKFGFGGLPFSAIEVAVFFGFLVLAPVALWAANFLSKFIPPVYQFAKFAAVGTLNSFIDLGIFNLETMMYGSVPGGWLYPVFKTASFLIATANSFLWNKFWTFGSSAPPVASEVVKFYSVTIVGWIINVGVATLVKNAAVSAGFAIDLWGNIVAPVFGIFGGMFWNFFGYKLLVFRKKAVEKAGI